MCIYYVHMWCLGEMCRVGYGKYASVTQMLFELGLPSCDAVLFNAKVRHTDSYSRFRFVSLIKIL